MSIPLLKEGASFQAYPSNPSADTLTSMEHHDLQTEFHRLSEHAAASPSEAHVQRKKELALEILSRVD